MWIFGYGSLVWKVDFPFARKIVGYIKGYERRFWQASIDHRGTPEKPGRVVTLIPSSDPEATVWGASYKIGDEDLDNVLRHLDHREVMGYEKVPIQFHPIPNHPLNSEAGEQGESTESFQVTMYYGSNENEHYVGEAPLDAIARQVWECVGPSGTNKDYLFNLCTAMRQIAQSLPPASPVVGKGNVIDAHLAQLETAVLKLEQRGQAIENNDPAVTLS